MRERRGRRRIETEGKMERQKNNAGEGEERRGKVDGHKGEKEKKMQRGGRWEKEETGKVVSQK